VAERGGDLAAGEDEALGDLGAGDLVHVRRRRLLLPEHRRGDARAVAPPLPPAGLGVAHSSFN
jgi:hypothetical protein